MQALPLKDIHIPEQTISWWPPAIGWWLLLIFVPLTLWLMVRFYKYLKRQTAVKTARKLLQQLQQDTNKTDAQKLVEISALIRRVAMSVAPRDECASLTGQAWLAYLDKSVKDNGFTQGVGRCLTSVGYRKVQTEDIDLPELIALTERWLKSQKTQKVKEKQ